MYVQLNCEGLLVYLRLEKPSFVQRITVMEYDRDPLSLVLFAGVFYKTSSNPFRKKYFLLLKIESEREKGISIN